MDNPFWNFSLAYYSKPAVAQLCLLAQDRYGVDVNFLLYAAWLSSRDQVLSTQRLAALYRETEQWRLQVVGPLRALRRQWRDLPEAAELRPRLQELELQSERSLQDRLWVEYQALAPVSGAGVLRTNLALVLSPRVPAGSEREILLDQLVAALKV